METINDVLQKEMEKYNKIIEQAEKNKNIVIEQQQQLELSNAKVAEIQQQIDDLQQKKDILQEVIDSYSRKDVKIQQEIDKLQQQKVKLQQYKDLDASKNVEIQQQIDDLYNRYNTELQSQEDLKQEINTKLQQSCDDFIEPQSKPELTNDEAAIRIQKIFQCFQIKIRRSKIPESFIKGLQEDTLKRLHLVYNFRTGEKRKFKHLLYNLSMRGRRTIINILDKTIYNSEKVVCKIPGCNDLIHPKDIDLHIEKEHLSYYSVYYVDEKDWTMSAENKAIFKAIKNQDFEEECSICRDKLNNGEEIMYLPCTHVFHKKCIKEWFKKCSTCPCCRGISTADPDLKQYNVRRYVRKSNILIRNICHEICTAEKRNHERCTRLAHEGCNRCWQHARFGNWWG
uniref:RING-type domain-containing protein n=1 Tax=viral metagenome TaxID=1070528 RepID=A0A6C0F8V3_9ZZZZ|tara:strand:- start:33478 stop:34671 length:1194 start_codon:yes stop_codon:yes gene_type:complete